MGDEVMQQEDGAVTSASTEVPYLYEKEMRQALTESADRFTDGAPWTQEPAAVAGHGGGFRDGWHARDAEVQRLTDELAQARAEIERARQQKVTDDELYRRCDQRWIGAEQRLKEIQAERNAVLAVVEAARKGVYSARSALGGGPCAEVEQACAGCAVEMQDASDYLDEALAAFDKARQ